MNYIEFYRGLNIAIIPVKAKSKQTWVNWKQYQEIPPTPEDYQQWFPESYQGNYAAVCGKASDNLFVLDCDTPGIEQTLFPDWQKVLQETLVVETSPKKYHVYFRGGYSFDRIQYNDGAGKEILSIRSQGAYVIVPPSIHPDTGTPYKIVSSSQTIQFIEDLQGFFEGIKWILKPKKKSKPLAKKTFTEGNRNNALFREACLFHQRNLAFEAAKAALSEINQLQCEPPLGENEIDSILKSAYKYDLSADRTELLSAILQAKETQEIYNLVANYLIAHNQIKSDKIHEDYYIYNEQEGIYQSHAEVYLEAQIDEINPAFSKQAKNEILYKVFTRTPFNVLDFNKQKVIACANGVIDLETLEVNPFSPDFWITRKLPVVYDPTAVSDSLTKFMKDISNNDQDMIHSLYEILADCLNSHYHSQKLHLWIGKGANGKGTLARLFIAFLGDKNVSKLGINQLNRNFATGDLFGKLANIDGDMSAKEISYTGILKQMSGEDAFSCDRKNQKRIEFTNTAKGIFLGQEVPTSYDETDGFYRRWLVYTFTQQFPVSDFEDTFITPAVLSACLNEVLKAHKRHTENKYHFTIEKHTPTIETQKIAYDFVSNNVKAFWEYACEYQLGEKVPKYEAYEHYKKFCVKYGFVIKDERQFAKDLKKYAPRLQSQRPRVEGKQIPHWVNLTLRELSDLRSLNSSIYQTFSSTRYRRPSLTQSTQSTQSTLIEERILAMITEAEGTFINLEPTVDILVMFENFERSDVRKTIDQMLTRGVLYESTPGVLRIP